MRVIVHPKTDRVRQRLDKFGDLFTLVEECVFQGEPAIKVESVAAAECCGGRKYHYKGWFKTSEAEWTEQKD